MGYTYFGSSRLRIWGEARVAVKRVRSVRRGVGEVNMVLSASVNGGDGSGVGMVIRGKCTFRSGEG